MAMLKQDASQHRQWTDRLPHLVCACALFTLLTAILAGVLGQRLDALAQIQKDAALAARAQSDQSLSNALGQAKTQWEKQKAILEKELLSVKLKAKAEQKTNASIRNRLVLLQNELAALKTAATLKTGAALKGSSAPTPTKAIPAADKAANQPPTAQTTAPLVEETSAPQIQTKVAAAPPAATVPAKAPETAAAEPLETAAVQPAEAPTSAVLELPEAGDDADE